jgi:urease gamma subunit
MQIAPHERDKLLMHLAAQLAKERKNNGVKLNYPEAVAWITDYVVEGAREGSRSVAQLAQDAGNGQVLTRNDVLPGVPEMIEVVQVEATFKDGTKCVTVENVIP